MCLCHVGCVYVRVRACRVGGSDRHASGCHVLYVPLCHMCVLLYLRQWYLLGEDLHELLGGAVTLGAQQQRQALQDGRRRGALRRCTFPITRMHKSPNTSA